MSNHHMEDHSTLEDPQNDGTYLCPYYSPEAECNNQTDPNRLIIMRINHFLNESFTPKPHSL